MNNHGWSVETVKETINCPFTTRASTNSAQVIHPATVFYTKSDAYVIVDNITRQMCKLAMH
jgi:hypothetical protein